MITARSAGKLIRDWVKSQSIPEVTVTAETVSFSDLARCSVVVVHIENGETLTQAEWRHINMLATTNNFFIG